MAPRDALGALLLFTTALLAAGAAPPVFYVGRVAGSGFRGFEDGGINAATAMFNAPRGVARSPDGGVYFTDVTVLRTLSPSGSVRIVCGQRSAGFADGGCAQALFENLAAIASDVASGNVYLADGNNNAVRWVQKETTVTTLVGGGYERPGFEDGLGKAALLSFPCALALDVGAGFLFVGERGNNAVRRVDLWGAAAASAAAAAATAAPPATAAVWDGAPDPSPYVAKLGGNSTAGFLPGAGTNALFNAPCGLAIGDGGSGQALLFIADTGNGAVRATPRDEAVARSADSASPNAAPSPEFEVLCGTGEQGQTDGDCDGGAQLFSPTGLLPLSYGRGLLLADANRTGGGGLVLLQYSNASGGVGAWTASTVAGGQPFTKLALGGLGQNMLSLPATPGCGLVEVNSSYVIFADPGDARLNPSGSRLLSLSSATFAYPPMGAIRVALLLRPSPEDLLASNFSAPSAAAPDDQGLALAASPRLRAALSSALTTLLFPPRTDAAFAFSPSQCLWESAEGAWADELPAAAAARLLGGSTGARVARGLRVTFLISYEAATKSRVIVPAPVAPPQIYTQTPSSTRGSSPTLSPSSSPAPPTTALLASMASGLASIAAKVAEEVEKQLEPGELGAIWGLQGVYSVTSAVDPAVAPTFVALGSGDPQPPQPPPPPPVRPAGTPRWVLYAAGGGAGAVLLAALAYVYVAWCDGPIPCRKGGARRVAGVEFSRTRRLHVPPPRAGPTPAAAGALALRLQKKRADVADSLGLGVGVGGL